MADTENKYTHGHHASVLRSHSVRGISDSAGYLADHLAPELSLLDIGAGPGSITVEFAERVKTVTATEINDQALQLSRDAAAAASRSNIDFVVADVHALPFADNTFDITHAHQVLQHVANPVLALQEMARVTKPGGLLAARDTDYAGFFWYPQLPELEQWLTLYRKAAFANDAQPDAARHFRQWCNQAGLAEAEITGSTWCFSSESQRAWWGGMWADRILNSALTQQLLDSDLASPAQLQSISAAWRKWAADPDALIVVPHGEILWRKPSD